MLICKKDKLYSQRGVTLIELLIALSILAFTVGIASIWVRNTLPSLTLKSATNMIENDLKRARMASLTLGETITTDITQSGYKIEALLIEREWASGLQIEWSIVTPITYTSGLPGSGGHITLKNGNHRSNLLIQPVTGRIVYVR